MQRRMLVGLGGLVIAVGVASMVVYLRDESARGLGEPCQSTNQCAAGLRCLAGDLGPVSFHRDGTCTDPAALRRSKEKYLDSRARLGLLGLVVAAGVAALVVYLRDESARGPGEPCNKHGKCRAKGGVCVQQ